MPANNPRPNLRRLLLVLAISCVVLVGSLPANANSKPLLVTVTGDGYYGATSLGLDLSAGIFSASSAWPDGPSILAYGIVGVPMSLSWGVTPFSGYGYTYVMYGNTFTDILSGGINFSSSITIPASALTTGTFTAPVTVSGFIQAFQDINGANGPLIATLAFSGKGTGTFTGYANGNNTFVIEYADVTFTTNGTLTAAPELSSLLMVGTGLLGLAISLKHRQRSLT